MNISVIICCHNSVSRLPITLQYLASQKVKTDLEWEIILVDNLSIDDTAKVASEIWELTNSPVPFKIVFERQLGLSFARMKGVAEARGEILVFCDDDNWLHSDYLQLSYELMTNHPQVGALSGRIEPVSEEELPFWFTSFQNKFAVGALGMESGDITHQKFVWGAGMVLRKQIYENSLKAGLYHRTPDRKGEELSSGGDNEISIWTILMGYRLWYDENLLVRHFMPTKRLNKIYLKRLSESIDNSSKLLKVYNPHVHIVLYCPRLMWKKTPIYLIKFILGELKLIERDLRLFYKMPVLLFLLSDFDQRVCRIVKGT